MSVRRLGQAMAAASADVQVFALADAFSAADAASWFPLAPTVCPSMRWGGLGYSGQLRDRLYNSPCDVVHLHGLWMYPSVAVLHVGKRRGTPSIISPRGMLDPWALRNARWKKRIASWLFEKRNLRSAACLHALCESEYESIRAYGLTNPVCVIPNGVDLPEDESKLAPPWRDTVEPGRNVLLFLGRIHPKKGLAPLIEAWSRLRQCCAGVASNWALAIAGWSQNGHEEELRRMVTDKRLIRDVLFLGPVFDEAKKACLQNANAFILPSHSEGLPVSVLEAWSYSLPVLMTTECNIPEGFQRGAAVAIRPEAQSIEQGLESFLSRSQTEQRKMGLNGRRLVETRFTWPHIAGRMLDVYKWVLGQGLKPGCVRSA